MTRAVAAPVPSTAGQALPELRLRTLGRVGYREGLALQDELVRARRAGEIPDTLLLLEHPHVITLGSSSDPAHVLVDEPARTALGIELFETGRGGDVTYHGPGQLVVYVMVELQRLRLGVRDLVTALERSVIDYVGELGVAASSRADAPGVYVGGSKLASVGIRVRRGASYHGLAFNVNMDLEPFSRINPCGHQGLRMTRLVAHAGDGVRGEGVLGQGMRGHGVNLRLRCAT